MTRAGKIDFDGYAQAIAHSKARNKRFWISAHLLKTNVFKPSYGAFFVTLLADPEDLKTLSAHISAQN
jgi:hypothetical protein